MRSIFIKTGTDYNVTLNFPAHNSSIHEIRILLILKNYYSFCLRFKGTHTISKKLR